MKPSGAWAIIRSRKSAKKRGACSRSCSWSARFPPLPRWLTRKAMIPPAVKTWTSFTSRPAEAKPNELVNPDEYSWANDSDAVTWSRALDPVERQKWQRVIRCPVCRVATQVDFDPVQVRIIHRCQNPDCPFDRGAVPVYVVDN